MEAGDTKRQKSDVSAINTRKKLCATKRTKSEAQNVSKMKSVNIIDICIVISSLLAYIVDTVTDLLVCAQYFHAGHYVWGAMTLTFILLPSLIIQIFSARWYSADNKMKGFRWVMHIFLLQPLERYLFAIVTGLHARRTGDSEVVNEYYYQHNDVSMLRLIEAFLESAPQLTLQLYVILCTDNAHWLTGMSACISLLAVGWAVTAYGHALRKAYRETYHVFWPGLILQTLWHIGIVAARVLALIVFTSVFQLWICLVIGGHWLLMTLWVVLQKTDFCPTRCEEFLFDCTIGVVYNFSFFNLKEGHTRWRISAYYSLMLAENAVLMSVWYPYRNDSWFDLPLLVSVFALFAVGISCMILYYRFCHPSGPIRLMRRQKTQELDLDMVDPLARAPPPYQSTPAFKAARPKNSTDPQQDTPKMAPRTSTVSLPRRALLKSQISSRLDVQFQEVATPSQLSPIKACRSESPASYRKLYADCTTLNLDEASAYRHFSVDASAFFHMSRCHTLEGTGVDLSRGSLLDAAPSKHTSPRTTAPLPQYRYEEDERSLGSLLSDADDSANPDLDQSPRNTKAWSPGNGTDSGHSTEHSQDRPPDAYHTPIDLSLCQFADIPYIDESSDFLCLDRNHISAKWKETRLIRDTDTL